MTQAIARQPFRTRSGVEAKGNIVETEPLTSPIVSGSVSNAGWLNGTAQLVFQAFGDPTPKPTAFTGFARFTFTTGNGQLQGSALVLYDTATGQGTNLLYVDPTASTGIFAGATGTLFENLTQSTVTSTTLTVQVELSGQVCFAGQ
jgi:hypothetical protein